jgi:plastocyanin
MLKWYRKCLLQNDVNLDNMKKCLLAFFSLLSFYGCTSGGKSPAEDASKIPAVAKADTVIIRQMKFTPADLSVNEGDTVVWINSDIVDHNITEEGSKEWSSGNLAAGKTWKMVAVKNADYFCSIHPVMKGRLSVR